MVRAIHCQIHDQLLVLLSVFWELFRGHTRFECHYLFKVIGYIAGKNHFDYYLSHIPILCLAQKLKYIILRVEQELESNGAVMIF